MISVYHIHTFVQAYNVHVHAHTRLSKCSCYHVWVYKIMLATADTDRLFLLPVNTCINFNALYDASGCAIMNCILQ